MYKRRNRDSRRNTGNDSLNMAAMIDVVFLLLVFFVLAIDPEAVMAKLEVNRPQHSETKTEKTSLVIAVSDGLYQVNGTSMTEIRLRSVLNKISRFNSDTSVLVSCQDNAPHSRLLTALDACREAELSDISLFSINK